MEKDHCQDGEGSRRCHTIVWLLAASFVLPVTLSSPAAIAKGVESELARCRRDDSNCDRGQKKGRDRERRDRDREKENRDRQKRDRENRERDKRDRERKDREERQRERDRKQREKENRDRQKRDRENRERNKRDRENRDREKRERENRDREKRDREQRERNKRDRENRDREKRERENRDREKRERENRDRQKRDRESRERDKRDRERKDREERQRERDRKQRENENRDRTRREREREREREARRRERRRDNQERVDRDLRRRERERYQREREERRRRREEREYRERRERERARRHRDRDRMRRDWERIQRRQSQRRREMRRDRGYWHDRHNRWRDDVYRRRPYRPSPPSYPIIDLPDPIYDGDNYWSYYEVAEVSHSIEVLSQKIYMLAESELRDQTSWNNDAIGALYDVVKAAQIYDDAVDNNWYDFDASIYELFNLEESLKEAKAYIDCGPLSYKITENFEYMESLVQELLWTYRLYDPNDSFHSWGLMGKKGRPKVPELNSAPVCETSDFWWSKPHKETNWVVFDQGQKVVANNLKLQVVDTHGQRGPNGVAGVSTVEVRYQDGQVQELVAEALYKGHQNSHWNGQLAIKRESDVVHLPYLLEKEIYSIRIVADSWISPDNEVHVKMTLYSTGPGSSRALTYRP